MCITFVIRASDDGAEDDFTDHRRACSFDGGTIQLNAQCLAGGASMGIGAHEKGPPQRDLRCSR